MPENLPDLRTVEIDLAAWGVATPGNDPFAGSVTGHITLVESDGSTSRPRWVSDYLLLQGQLVDHSDRGDPLSFDVLPSDLDDMDGTYYRLELSMSGVMRIVNFEVPSGSGTYQLSPDTIIDPDIGPQTVTTVYDAVQDILLAGANVTLTEDDTAFTITIAATGGGNGGGGVTLRYGAADPDDSLGANGDWYLQTTTKDWFQKVSGAWVERSGDSTVATALATTTLPTPVEALVGRVFNDDGNLVVCRRFLHPGHGLEVDWTAWQHGDDVSAYWTGQQGVTFRGVRDRAFGLSNPANQDVYVTPGGQWWRRIANNIQTGWFTFSDPNGWIGEFNDETHADGQVTADSQIAEWGNHVYISSNYSAAADADVTYGYEQARASAIPGEDSITPAMLDADTDSDKEAFRTRIDVTEDIADWAEAGSSDLVPVSKLVVNPEDAVDGHFVRVDSLGDLDVTAVPVVSQSDAEAGTATDERLWTAQRVAQSIAALASGGGGGGLTQAQVDARVTAGVIDEAETGNTDPFDTAKIPDLSASKITSGTLADARIPASIARDSELGLKVAAYSSTATYARGSDNSIVTHSDGLFIYTSTTSRSSGHDPDNQPGYWLRLSEGMAYEVISSGSHRIAARTLVVNGDNDNVYLCTTTQTTPRDLTYIHTESESAGGAFILLNGAGSGGTTVVANPSGTDGSDLTRITIGEDNYNIAGGSGGGGDSSVELWTGDLDIGTSNQWVAAGTDVVPAAAEWILFNGGALTSDVEDAPNADWKWINAADWRLLTAASASDAVTDGTGMLFVDWVSNDIETTNFTRRDVKIGRTSTNTVLVAVMDASEDLTGAAIRYVTGVGGTAVAANPTGTDGTDLTRLAIGSTNYNLPAGGGGGGSGDVTGIDAGTGIRIDDGDTATPEVNIADDGVDTAQLADAAVETAQLADDAVTGAKIADATIHGGALIDDTIATGKIGDGQVTGAKLSSNAVSTGKIADDAVTGDKIADATIHGGALIDGTIATIKIGDSQVTSAKLAANAAGEGKVPIDDTMQFDSDGDLGVNTQRVVQEVSEWVQHFASGDSHDTSGHTGKYQEYTSSNTVRRVGSVQYDFTPDNANGAKTYRVYIIELTGRNVDAVLGVSQTYSGNSLQHRFHFTDGVLINPAVRIGIGLHRTDGGGNNYGLSVRSGTESQDSPRESYDDASNDFHFEGRFNHDRQFPSVGDTVGGTAANQIYGNPEIFYQIIHTHASLVGDGTVGVSHISSGSSADGTVLTADGSGGVAFESPAGLVDGAVTKAKLAQSVQDTLDDTTIFVPATGVSLVSSDANHIELDDSAIPDPPTNGTRIVFVPENDTTGGVQIRIGSNDYTLQKSNEPDTGAGAMSSGDIEGQHPIEITYSGTGFWWTGGVLGSAARSNTIGADGHSPRFNTGTAFPTDPTPLSPDLFLFTADVASGLDWKDTDGTTDLTSADEGDLARYDGTDWVLVLNLRGPAGEAGAGGGSGGVAIGDSIGTHRMVNSYTTSRMYSTTVPTPAADDGDLLVITYEPDDNSPDNAEGGSEVAFVPLANVLAIPNAYSGSSSTDAEGDNRDGLRTGFGQNDWLYLGVTALTGGNLTIGSTDAKYAGVFTFRILTYGTSGGGQESPAGVASLTPDYVHTLFYKYAETEPDAHAANWRFDDEWSNTDGPSTDSYYNTAASALENAELNPEFVEADSTLWECRGQFRRRLNNDGDAYLYNDSKEVFAVFGEQFSEDADSWHGEQTDDDIWQRTRTALGDWGTPTYIGAPSAVEWEVLRTFVNIYSTGGDYNTILLSTDLTEAEELRFRMYGLASGVTRRAPIIEQILTRPDGGWPVVSALNGNFVNDMCFQWRYGAQGLNFDIVLMGDMTTALAGHTTQEVQHPTEINTVYTVTIGAGGRFKFYSSSNDEADVDNIIFFDQPGTYQRVRMEVSRRL